MAIAMMLADPLCIVSIVKDIWSLSMFIVEAVNGAIANESLFKLLDKRVKFLRGLMEEFWPNVVAPGPSKTPNRAVEGVKPDILQRVLESLAESLREAAAALNKWVPCTMGPEKEVKPNEGRLNRALKKGKKVVVRMVKASNMREHLERCFQQLDSSSNELVMVLNVKSYCMQKQNSKVDYAGFESMLAQMKNDLVVARQEDTDALKKIVEQTKDTALEQLRIAQQTAEDVGEIKEQMNVIQMQGESMLDGISDIKETLGQLIALIAGGGGAVPPALVRKMSDLTASQQQGSPQSQRRELQGASSTSSSSAGGIDPRLSTPWYTIEIPEHNAVLGQGSFGTIYKANWLGHNVAVKLVRTDPADTPEEVQEKRVEFLREVEATATMRSSFTTQIYAACFEKDRMALVLELLPAMDLRRRLNRDGPPQIAHTLKILRDILSGVSYMHKLGLVHRDIKSSNVLLHMGGAKLSDFGKVHDTGSHLKFDDELKNFTIKSTAKYQQVDPTELLWVAPEMLLLMKHPRVKSEELLMVDLSAGRFQSDTYGVGVIAWELLTGDEPFKMYSHSLLEQLKSYKRTSMPFVQLHPLPPGAPPAIAYLVKTCTNPCWAMRPDVENLHNLVSDDVTYNFTTGEIVESNLTDPAAPLSGTVAPIYSPTQFIFAAAKEMTNQINSGALDTSKLWQAAYNLHQVNLESGDIYYSARSASELAILRLSTSGLLTGPEYESILRLIQYAKSRHYQNGVINTVRWMRWHLDNHAQPDLRAKYHEVLIRSFGQIQ